MPFSIPPSLCWPSSFIRTSLWKMRICMAPCLYQLFSGVIRQSFQWQQATMSFGHCTCLLGMFATESEGLMGMASSSLASCPYLEVSTLLLQSAYCLFGWTAGKQHAGSVEFWNFWQQMFHSSLREILSPLRPGMTEPEVLKCPDGQFQHVVYGIGPYITDYPEQVLLTCIIQNWCPKYEAFPFLIYIPDGCGK